MSAMAEWLGAMNPVAVAMSKGSAEGGARIKQINEHFFKAVGDTAIGQAYTSKYVAITSSGHHYFGHNCLSHNCLGHNYFGP